MEFSIEQLNAFVTVYEKGSLNEAAVKLGKHRSTIRQVITNLEDTLAVELFERVGRKVIPTSDADVLYHYGKLAVEQVKAFDKMALSLSFGELQEINIGYCSFIPNPMLVAIRLRLQAAFPQATIHFYIKNKQEIKQGITTGDIQFGIVNIDDRSARHSFDSTLLNYMNFALFCSDDHPLTSLTESEVYRELKITRQFVLKSYLDDNIGDKVLLSPDVEVIDDVSLLINLVQQGLGFALLPRVVVQQLVNSFRLQELVMDEMKDDICFPIALWSAYAKPVLKIKVEIKSAINDYLQQNLHLA